MNKLLSFFKQRWLISFLGILALALLIWWLGPLVAIGGWEPLASPLSRLVTILVILLLWGLNQLRRYRAAKRKNDELLKDLAEAPPNPAETASAEEIAELKARFDEALKILKQARLDHRYGGQYLYQLPWYIIIGPPGSGKTTALRHSGLNFPLAKQFGDEIQGVGGTRNCDWFFTDEAVLLDTAGRYTTQDSYQAVDQAAWTGFLELLKTYRRRRPINGALVAISAPELLGLSGAERAAHARAIKQRLQELHQRLGIRFPVYVLFTKCDLLAGFTEFFSDLGREERAQVWGMTLPMDELESPHGVVEHFTAEFEAIEHRLNERLLERLQQERDGRRRDFIYLFPQQFNALKSVADRFLQELFQPSRFEERFLLRGVYFTSGTQEGTPVDRIMGALASAFRLDRQSVPSFSGTGRSYFITRLFRDVIFQESGLAGANLKLERQRVWLQRGAYAGVLLLTGLITAAWGVSYLRNQAYVDEVARQAQAIAAETQQLSPAQRNILAVLPLLDEARNIPGGYQDRDAGAPLLMGFGLYQGDKLGVQGAIPAYRRLLDNAFLPRIMLRLEEQLSQPKADNDYLYEALKVYLMLNDPEHFNASTVKDWFALDWEQSLARTADAARRQALLAHLDALLEKLPSPLPYAADPALIRQVQDRLARVPPAQRIYARLKREGLGEDIPSFRISEAGGRDAPRVFIRNSGKPLSEGIPGLYTYAGYHEVFIRESGSRIKQLAAESWVLGPHAQSFTDPQQRQQLSDQVRQLYLQDYAQQWEGLLGDLNIRPLANLQEAVVILNVLSGVDSPLIRLLVAMDRETALERPQEQKPAEQLASQMAEQTAEQTASNLTSRIPGAGKLRELLGQSVTAEIMAPAAKGLNYVEERFAALHRLVQSKALEAMTPLLMELFAYLDAIASAADQGGAALEAAKKQAGGVINKLKQEASRQPPPLNRWLKTLADDSANLTLGGMRSHLNVLWTAEVLPFCQQAIQDRYPLIRGSSREVTLEDFGRFFGPAGLMDNFFQKFLQTFVDTTQKPWRWRTADGAATGIIPEALNQFQRAAVVKETFFRAGGQTPAIRFELTPLSLDAEATQFLLDLEGQKITYSHGPAKSTPLQWPGPEPGRVQIAFSPPGASGRSGLTEDGPWAWFRLLDKTDMSPTRDPERFTVTFRVDNRYIRYELRASSAFNPFRLKELAEFNCSPRL